MAPGITALAPAPGGTRAHLVLTGGADKAALVFDVAQGRVAARLLPLHGKRVTDVAWHPSPEASDALFTASADGTVKAWARVGAAGASADVAEYAPSATLRPHGGREVTGLAMHPLGTYAASCGRDGAWAFSDTHAGRVLASVPVEGAVGLEALRFHPDGVLLGIAGSDGRVRVFDVRDQTCAVAFGAGTAGVSALAFSENGYHVASASAEGAVLWDLRKVTAAQDPVKTWAPSAAGAAATAVAFDFSGAFLAAGAADGSVAVWETKDAFAQLGATLRHQAGAVSGLAWGAASRTLTSTGATDRAMHVYALGSAPTS